MLRFARNDLWVALLAAAIGLLASSLPAVAVLPSEMLANPVLEARAEHIGSELRCLVCRDESIEESQADLAHDLRLLVRRLLVAGDSNAQVIAYIRSRYGDFVLLKPPFEAGTWLLWGGPPLVLALGALGIARFLYRRRGNAEPPPLSPDEQRRLATSLGEAGDA
ncbi:MAG TPA: cytochrome c-type biogenesis protein [Stellaceae bacterium]|nr:cytochrome c-type biogenesis protein [Stellaceae bacterium]